MNHPKAQADHPLTQQTCSCAAQPASVGAIATNPVHSLLGSKAPISDQGHQRELRAYRRHLSNLVSMWAVSRFKTFSRCWRFGETRSFATTRNLGTSSLQHRRPKPYGKPGYCYLSRQMWARYVPGSPTTDAATAVSWQERPEAGSLVGNSNSLIILL